MRVGTIMNVNTETGYRKGAVSNLVSPQAVDVSFTDGSVYRVYRGQGHKDPDQRGQAAHDLRAALGITVGPCQKTTFGADVVHEIEKQPRLNSVAKQIKAPTTQPTMTMKLVSFAKMVGKRITA